MRKGREITSPQSYAPMQMQMRTSLHSRFICVLVSVLNVGVSGHGALQLGAVIALVAYYLVWLDRTQIWVQNYLNKNGSNVADLYAALRRRMRTTAAGSHSTSPDQELHIYVGSVPTLLTRPPSQTSRRYLLLFNSTVT